MASNKRLRPPWLLNIVPGYSSLIIDLVKRVTGPVTAPALHRVLQVAMGSDKPNKLAHTFLIEGFDSL